MAADNPSPSATAPELGSRPAPFNPQIHSRPSDRRVLIALCSGTFLASLITIAPPPFFPDMAHDMHVDFQVLGQIMT